LLTQSFLVFNQHVLLDIFYFGYNPVLLNFFLLKLLQL
jgi:hypothetical protein